MYNTLLMLSRNTFFYSKIKLSDSFETRIYLMFFHFAIMMIIFKKKGSKFNQKSYDLFFHNIENDLRELGFGDVTVNKKMKEYINLFHFMLSEIHFWNNLTKSEKLVKFSLFLKDFGKIEHLLDYFDDFNDVLSKKTLNSYLKSVSNP